MKTGLLLVAIAVAAIAFLPKKRKRTVLDAPEISKVLFHPFAQEVGEPDGFEIVETPVEDAVLKLHLFRNADANEGDVVIFFHGNGEIAADWFPYAREIAGAFKANLVIADYRGYGLSTGSLTYGNMLADAEVVFDAVKLRFRRRIHVFGRSIGSASAIHVAWRNNGKVVSLVIDSGFAHIDALIERLGKGRVNPPGLPKGFRDNVGKLGEIECPALFLHGCDDSLIPIDAARENFTVSISPQKQLVALPGAGHNDTMLSRGYFGKIADFVESIPRTWKSKK